MMRKDDEGVMENIALIERKFLRFNVYPFHESAVVRPFHLPLRM